jgi:hypothetical protein
MMWKKTLKLAVFTPGERRIMRHSRWCAVWSGMNRQRYLWRGVAQQNAWPTRRFVCAWMVRMPPHGFHPTPHPVDVASPGRDRQRGAVAFQLASLRGLRPGVAAFCGLGPELERAAPDSDTPLGTPGRRTEAQPPGQPLSLRYRNARSRSTKRASSARQCLG